MVRTGLTLSLRRSLSYKNQSLDLQSKSMDWSLYDSDHRHNRTRVVTQKELQLSVPDRRKFPSFMTRVRLELMIVLLKHGTVWFSVLCTSEKF